MECKGGLESKFQPNKFVKVAETKVDGGLETSKSCSLSVSSEAQCLGSKSTLSL
jgi:hypothetical protein